MSDLTYPRPLLISGDECREVKLLEPHRYDEKFIQDLTFRYPNCLPTAEIDSAYMDLVPVCKEMRTPSGYVDALFVSRSGRLVIAESKLWRNPESRRKVVAQILDYAKEFSNWDYESLQREVNRALGKKGNELYRLVNDVYPDVDERLFVDEVQKSLERGRFMLLIIGDGIREGAASITAFLESVGSLEFTFGLVEIQLFEQPGIGTLVVPRVLARTVEFKRVVVSLPEGARLSDRGDEDEKSDADDDGNFHSQFWAELVSELELDDPSQPMANAGNGGNLIFVLPPSGSQAWISAFFAQSKSRVGVYVTFSKKGNFGDLAFGELLKQRDEIDEELSGEPIWDAASRSVVVRLPVANVFDPAVRSKIKEFFAVHVNEFVNAFRPRLSKIVEELKG